MNHGYEINWRRSTALTFDIVFQITTPNDSYTGAFVKCDRLDGLLKERKDLSKFALTPNFQPSA